MAREIALDVRLTARLDEAEIAVLGWLVDADVAGRSADQQKIFVALAEIGKGVAKLERFECSLTRGLLFEGVRFEVKEGQAQLLKIPFFVRDAKIEKPFWVHTCKLIPIFEIHFTHSSETSL